MRLTSTVLGESFTFKDVKDVLARANEPRSGDEQAGLAPRSMREMAAAKRVLGELTVKDLREHPSVPYDHDEVTRVVEDGLDQRAYKRICGWSVAQLREWILDDRTSGDDIKDITWGLVPEAAAAVAKLMSNMDLVLAGKKIRVVAVCNNTIGLPGRIA